MIHTALITGRDAIKLSRDENYGVILLGAICEFAQFINCAAQFVDS